VRGMVRTQTGQRKLKVGHTGTLDPLATGLLVLLIGDYTKKANELSSLDKTYEAIMKLGIVSTTGDEEGQKTPVSNKKPTQKEVEAVLESLVGEIEQIPPAFSAIKIDGQRAYKLARAGKQVKIAPRKVTIYSLEMTHYNYPEVKFITSVSSGTYIRSLVEDIGKKLGTGAYMSALSRVQVGDFRIENAVTVAELNEGQRIVTIA